MKQALTVAALLFAFAPPSSAQDACARNVESGFSYCPPEGWTMKPALGDKFKPFIGPPSPTFTPNINIKDEESTRSLDDHVAANIQTMVGSPDKAGAMAVRILEQSDFKTTSGERVVRVTIRVNTSSGAPIRAWQYYFKGRGTQYLVATCMSLESSADSYEPICDRSMRTLRVDR